MINFNQLDNRLESYYPRLERDLLELISIPSVQEDAEPGAPFGRAVANALNFTLDLAASLGFQTANIDGYCGVADLPGRCVEQVGVLGHLDVVPAQPEEWKYLPFAPVKEEGRIYGRGTMDDKGPLLAALYGAAALAELGVEFDRSVRFIFGCNEENGMQCVRYYLSKYQPPACGFTPDGSWPLVIGEKGIYQYRLGRCWPVAEQSSGLTLLGISAGTARNIVPARAAAVFFTDGDIPKLPERVGISAKIADGRLIVTAWGRAAHASVPDEGENALALLLDYLSALDFKPAAAHAFVRQTAILCTDSTRGTGFGVDGCDELSTLTHTPTMLRLDEKGGELICDMRFPITGSSSDYTVALKRLAEEKLFDFAPLVVQEPLYLGGDNTLAQTLLSAYREVTDDMSEPLVIGGGTYAKTMPNFLAFGPEPAGKPTLAHQADEYIEGAELLKSAKIYARAIYKLAGGHIQPARS